MIGILTKFSDSSQKVIAAKNKAVIKNLAHAAASLRKREIESVVKAEPRDPSPVGSPPHTHRKGRSLKTAFLFDVDKQAQDAVIGPRASHVGQSAQAHEFGGEYKGTTFPERPFAAPALELIAPRFGESFEGSIGE